MNFIACIEIKEGDNPTASNKLNSFSTLEENKEFISGCNVTLDFHESSLYAFMILPFPEMNSTIEISEESIFVTLLNNWVGIGVIAFWKIAGDSLIFQNLDPNVLVVKNGDNSLMRYFHIYDDIFIIITNSLGGDTGNHWGEIRYYFFRPFENMILLHSKFYTYDLYSDLLEFRNLVDPQTPKNENIILVEDHYKNIDQSFSHESLMGNYVFEYSDSTIINVKSLIDSVIVIK